MVCPAVRLTIFPGRQLGPSAPGKPCDRGWTAVVPTQLFIPHKIIPAVL